MGKTTSYTPSKSGTYSINGQTKATAKIDGGHVYGNYNMNEYEKKLYDYAQKTLSDIVPKVNVFSSDEMKEIQSKVNAYKKQGINDINSMYSPLIDNLKNDIASRFGNLDNSAFLDKLNGIESSRSNAIAQLAENLLLKQNDLVNNELSQRYNFINLLNSLQNQANANASDLISAALSLAKNGSVNTSSSNSSNLDIKSLASMFSTLSQFI